MLNKAKSTLKKLVIGEEERNVQFLVFSAWQRAVYVIRTKWVLEGKGPTMLERLAGGTASKAEPFNCLQSLPIFNIKGIWRETGQNIVFWETSNQMA